MDLWWSPLWYWSCYAIGQFFHSQCMQSIEPNIPGNPCVFAFCSRQLLLFGLLKYLSSNISFTSFTKAYKNWIVVHLAILMYSSTLSTSDPYVNIQIVAVHFYNGERPILLDASDLIWKYEPWLLRTSTIRRNNGFCIWNLRRNCLSVYIEFSKK